MGRRKITLLSSTFIRVSSLEVFQLYTCNNSEKIISVDDYFAIIEGVMIHAVFVDGGKSTKAI